jgi:hypothetical protein
MMNKQMRNADSTQMRTGLTNEDWSFDTRLARALVNVLGSVVSGSEGGPGTEGDGGGGEGDSTSAEANMRTHMSDCMFHVV